ncbi:MAG: ribosome assembly factor SBDS [Thermoplasmatota archaeon]
MVSLDEAVIARYKKGEDHFEILVDPHQTERIIEGKQDDVLSCLAIEAVFNDSKKGTHASQESLEKVFGTDDIQTIVKTIIFKGDIQLTTEKRHEMQAQKKKRIVDIIVKNAMDPQNKTPHPRQRIELAIEETGIQIDPFKSADVQVKTIIEKLRTIIPISLDQLKISVKIPSQYIGKAYGVARGFGALEREEWQSDGSWAGIVRIPAGMQKDFYDKLNDITKGNVETRILK